MNDIADTQHKEEKRTILILGALLIALGISLLANNFLHLHLEVNPPLIMGILFLIGGLLTKGIGFIIPGSILASIGVSDILLNSVFVGMEAPARGAVVLICIAVGFFLVSLLSKFVTHKLVKWPLIPGGVIGAVGLAILTGGPGLTALEYLGQVWPIVLIIIGAHLILKHK